MKFDILYRNIGKTIAENCLVNVALAEGNSDKWEETEINNDTTKFFPPTDLRTVVSGEFQIPGDAPFPDSLMFPKWLLVPRKGI